MDVNSLLLEMTPLYFKKLVKSIAKRLEAAIEAKQFFKKSILTLIFTDKN